MRTDRPGIALLLVVLLTMVVAAIAAGAALIGANSFLINEFDQRQSLLSSAADAGLELGRARLNADPSLLPTDEGYLVLERDAAVVDADGAVIADVRRSIYAGRPGDGAGRGGDVVTILAEARHGDGTRLIRRLDLAQSSFAAYLRFTHEEQGNTAFGDDEQLFGPVHSNDDIRVIGTGATFHGPVTTAGRFQGAQHAVFLGDTASGVAPILLPPASAIDRLQGLAAAGDLALAAPTGGAPGESTLRLEFIARDVDGDGVAEGFVRVYQSADAAWVTGQRTGGYGNDREALAKTWNCGHVEDNGRFFPTPADTAGHTPAEVLASPRARCYLGGADALWNGFRATDPFGAWRAWPGPVHPALAGQPDAAYLFPLDRRYNPGFRGVIHVRGKVVVSGRVRGRVTVAATDNIIIGDDLIHHADPGAGRCEDALGLVSGARVIVADNLLNAPQVPPGGPGNAYRTFDDTRDEFIHAAILALDRFVVEGANGGSASAEPCGAGAAGRGCLYLTGSVVQHAPGATGSASGRGYIRRYTHDACGFTDPPPHFPATGHFTRSRYHEVDPTGFDVAAFYTR